MDVRRFVRWAVAAAVAAGSGLGAVAGAAPGMAEAKRVDTSSPLLARAGSVVEAAPLFFKLPKID